MEAIVRIVTVLLAIATIFGAQALPARPKHDESPEPPRVCCDKPNQFVNEFYDECLANTCANLIQSDLDNPNCGKTRLACDCLTGFRMNKDRECVKEVQCAEWKQLDATMDDDDCELYDDADDGADSHAERGVDGSPDESAKSETNEPVNSTQEMERSAMSPDDIDNEIDHETETESMKSAKKASKPSATQKTVKAPKT